MWDVATPVMIGDRQFGNLFIGQFLFDDEPLDYGFFRSQARQYGFDETKYLAALEAVPRMSREILDSGMSFFMQLADLLSRLSYSNLKLARSLAECDTIMDSLRESEERFRKMFERHKAIMLLVEPESGAIVDTNAAAAEFYGYSHETLRGMNIGEINQLTPEEVAAERQRALEEQRNYFVFPHRLASGEIRWVEVSSTPIEAQGKSLLFSIIHDITARKRAEEEIVRAKEEWERTFDSVPDLIAILDNRHRVLRVNTAMARRLGVKPEECVGLPCYEVVHGSSCPPGICPHSQTIADGSEHTEELHEDRLGGDFLVTTTPLLDAKGERIGSVHISHDITERKRAEEEIRRRVEELRHGNEELARFNRASVGRELRMIALKKEVNAFCKQNGEPRRYPLDFEEEG
jgi:PAS domain S-box-containing protein